MWLGAIVRRGYMLRGDMPTPKCCDRVDSSTKYGDARTKAPTQGCPPGNKWNPTPSPATAATPATIAAGFTATGPTRVRWGTLVAARVKGRLCASHPQLLFRSNSHRRYIQKQRSKIELMRIMCCTRHTYSCSRDSRIRWNTLCRYGQGPLQLMTWQPMAWGWAQAGDRKSKTRCDLLWRENKPGKGAVASALQNLHNSVWYCIVASSCA